MGPLVLTGIRAYGSLEFERVIPCSLGKTEPNFEIQVRADQDQEDTKLGTYH